MVSAAPKPVTLRGMQALYADVPMSVCTADGPSPCFQARIGLKQGCPPSPTLFGLYIDDLIGLAAYAVPPGSGGSALRGAAWPAQPGGQRQPDATADMAMLATSVVGLAR